MAEDADRLRAKNERLRAALAVEQAAAVVVQHGLPPSFVQVLASTPVEEQEAKAQQIAQELQERVGDPAGSPDPVNQEHGGSPTGLAAGGEPPGAGPSRVSGPEEEFPEPEHFEALAATGRAGPEGGSPPDPGPVNPKDRRTEAIRSAGSWEELEQAVQPGRR